MYLSKEHIRKAMEALNKPPQPLFAIGVKLNEEEINIAGIICSIKDKLIDEGGHLYYRVALGGKELGLRIYLSEYLKEVIEL